MTSDEVLAMYENLNGLTGQMERAAKNGNWDEFSEMRSEAAVEARAALSGLPALDGTRRLRKIDLLKQVMAHDRAIREVTEPGPRPPQRGMRSN